MNFDNKINYQHFFFPELVYFKILGLFKALLCFACGGQITIQNCNKQCRHIKRTTQTTL